MSSDFVSSLMWFSEPESGWNCMHITMELRIMPCSIFDGSSGFQSALRLPLEW